MLVVIAFVLAPLAAVALIVMLVRTGQAADRPLTATATAARQHAGLTTALAVLAGALALPVGMLGTRSTSGLAVGLATGLLPALAGLAFLGVHAIGEATWPRPAGQVRRASLERRTIRDLAPRLGLTAVATWTTGLVVALLGFGLAADATGRTVSVTFENGGSTASPFPGWFYGLPLLGATALVLAATWGTLHLVATRPAVADAAPRWDVALRRLSAHRVLRGAQTVLGLTLVGVLGVAGRALHSAGSGGSVDGVPRVDALASSTGTVVMVCAVAVLLATLAVGVVPGTPASLGAERPAGDSPPSDLPRPAAPPAPPAQPLPPAPPPTSAPSTAS